MKTLAELRAAESDLVARAAAKAAEISKATDAEAVRTLEADHDRLLDDIEKVRGEISAAAEAERSTGAGDVVKVERERGITIRQVARKLGLPESFADEHVQRGTTTGAFREAAINEKARLDENGASVNRLPADGRRAAAQPRAERQKGVDAARIMIALAASRGDVRGAADYVSRHYGADGELAARALSTSIGSAGGFLVPEEMSSEVIELLRPASVVMSLNPVIVPMPRGNMSIPRVQAGATAGYVGENQPSRASQQGFGMAQLSAKKLTAVVPISNDMIRFPSIATDALVRDDMVEAVAVRGDAAFIRGAGTQFSPRGLRSFAASPAGGGSALIVANPKVGTDYAQSGGQPTAVGAVGAVTTDLGKAELALKNANVKMRRPGWLFSPRTETYLLNLRDGNANLVYATEMAMGKLRGKPYRITTQIPDNLAAVDPGNNATFDGSEITLADFAEVLIGEAYGLEIEVFPGGTYVDSNGDTQSGIANDQTVMRAIVQHDMNMRQPKAVVVITGVRWF